MASLKKQIALASVLALAGTAAQAQSSVTLYGILDVSFGSFENAHVNGTDARLTQVESGKLTTSFFGFKGVEDLGNGLKALFTLESFMRMDTGASGRTNADVFWARNAHVGLQGSFGKVIAGRTENFLYQQALSFNPFGGSFGFSPTIRLTYGAPFGVDKGDSGWSNTIAYYAPTISGFSFAGQVQMGESETESDSAGLMIGYASGPFAIGYGYQEASSAEAPKPNFVSGKQTFSLLGASYDFGAVKLFGQIGQYQGKDMPAAADNTKTNLYQLGVAVPVGTAGKVLASYGEQTKELTAGDVKHSIFTLGYDHNLSKRTDAYVIYMRDDDDRANWEAGNTLAVGVRHRF